MHWPYSTGHYLHLFHRPPSYSQEKAKGFYTVRPSRTIFPLPLAYRLEQTALPENLTDVSLEILQQFVQKLLLSGCKFGHRLRLPVKLCVRMTTYTV